MKASIVNVIQKLDLTLTNPDDVKSLRDYNRYIVDYPSVLGTSYLKENLIVETAVYQRAYPTVRKTASSLIYDYLLSGGFTDFINEYGLEPFELNVQAIEGTFIDKLYALADYYIANSTTEHPRHIYDIYKLLSVVSIDDNLKSLAKSVTEERKPHSRSLSVQDEVNINKVLREIIDKKTYADDYKAITEALLFENVPYETAVSALVIVLDSGLFD